MENFTTPNYSHLEEIKLSIYDSDVEYYGGDQNWYHKKSHRLSGCGPVAAANITAYLSQTFPDKYSDLYPFKGPFNKSNFVEHMTEIRKYVKPGIFGLTCVKKFSKNVIAFSNNKGLTLTPHILEKIDANMDEAIDFVSKALSEKLPVAILVLKHAVKEFEDYAWHWMTITHLKHDPEDNKPYITVSTYGERHEINLDILWNSRRPKDIIRLVYFT